MLKSLDLKLTLLTKIVLHQVEYLLDQIIPHLQEEDLLLDVRMMDLHHKFQVGPHPQEEAEDLHLEQYPLEELPLEDYLRDRPLPLLMMAMDLLHPAVIHLLLLEDHLSEELE